MGLVPPHPSHRTPLSARPGLEQLLWATSVWSLAPPRDRKLRQDGLPAVSSEPGTPQTHKKRRLLGSDRLDFRKQFGCNSGRSRLGPELKGTESRGAEHVASDPRRPGGPALGARPPPRPREAQRRPAGTRTVGLAAEPSRGGDDAHEPAGAAAGSWASEEAPAAEPPAAPSTSAEGGARRHRLTEGGGTHPVLRLQLRHPLPPQRLQLLLRHGAAGRGRAAATTLGRICRSPARERGPPHCAGARGAQASPIQPGAAPPAAARPTGEARFRDGRQSGVGRAVGRTWGPALRSEAPQPCRSAPCEWEKTGS